MAVGRGRRLESGRITALDVKIGDRVLFGRYTGTETRLVGPCARRMSTAFSAGRQARQTEHLGIGFKETQ